jgi:hypothetical protein
VGRAAARYKRFLGIVAGLRCNPGIPRVAIADGLSIRRVARNCYTRRTITESTWAEIRTARRLLRPRGALTIEARYGRELIAFGPLR